MLKNKIKQKKNSPFYESLIAEFNNSNSGTTKNVRNFPELMYYILK